MGFHTCVTSIQIKKHNIPKLPLPLSPEVPRVPFWLLPFHNPNF